MFGKTRTLYTEDSTGGLGNDPVQTVDRGPKYPITQQVKETGYGVDIKGRKIVIVKDKYDMAPDPITNEPKKFRSQTAYVIDSVNGGGDPDTKQDYIDGLNDEEFKMLADAGVIILDETGNKRYLQVLQDVTNTKPLAQPKK